MSTTALEDVAASGRRGDLFALFQLYCLRDRAEVKKLIGRAERAGYRGLVLTVDAPVSGKRERDMRNQFAVSREIWFPNLEGFVGSGPFQLARFDDEVDPSLTWDVVRWIREGTSLPLFLKGILNGVDAALAIEHGASGIIVSNHGGRQLDTTPAAIEVLPEIRSTVRSLDPSFPVYVDGGIRRGTDVFKAMALGADAVLVGRPCIYGLAVDGYLGVARVLTILKEEFVQTMKLAGCRSLAEIEPEMVRYADEFGPATRPKHCGYDFAPTTMNGKVDDPLAYDAPPPARRERDSRRRLCGSLWRKRRDEAGAAPWRARTAGRRHGDQLRVRRAASLAQTGSDRR